MTQTAEITLPEAPNFPVESLTAFNPGCNICLNPRYMQNGVWQCPHCDDICTDPHCQVTICVSTRSRRMEEKD